ncbi:MAG: hypothetical protein HYS34_11565 [Acidobacteria bacterium]|nr:hypothetical protein [Acidobacteriota bacterium]
MSSVKTLFALLPLAALATLSCSKTQDTAPERRIFGDPPTIQTVEQNFFDPAFHVSCDFSEIVVGQVCELSGEAKIIVEPQPGPGWVRGRKPGLGSVVNPEAGVFVEGTYGEATMRVTVTDPNSTSAQNNILLVSASFIKPDSKNEDSIVMFDDGAENHFMFPQRVSTPGESCTGVNDPTEATCKCVGTSYPLDSGDTNKNDDEFTRRLAFHKPTANPYLLDCIQRDRHATLILASTGTTFTFKIEAVDRQGNLSTWPQSLPLTTGDDSFDCTGDPCGCCVLQFGGLDSACNGLEGMTSPDVFPDGLCVTTQL